MRGMAWMRTKDACGWVLAVAAFIALVLLPESHAQESQLYNCDGVGGNPMITNIPAKDLAAKDCKKEPSYDLPTNTGAGTVSRLSPPPKVSTPVPAGTPGRAVPALSKVEATTLPTAPKTQAERDRKRGEVLLYELGEEQRQLKEITQALAQTQPDNADRFDYLKNRQDNHTLNIKALFQELARLGYVDHSRD